MSKLEEAKMIVRLNNEIKRTDNKLDFIRSGRYQDEFLIGYSEEGNVTEYNSMELSMSDVECLREFWENMKKELEEKLSELLK